MYLPSSAASLIEDRRLVFVTPMTFFMNFNGPSSESLFIYIACGDVSVFVPVAVPVTPRFDEGLEVVVDVYVL